MKNSVGSRRALPTHGLWFSRGMSIIDLAVALVIAVLLFHFATPSLNQLIQKWHSRQVVSNLVEAVKVARFESLLREDYVTLCPSANQLNCADPDTADWAGNVIAFLDQNRNKSLDPHENLLYSTRLVSGKGRLSFATPGGRQYLQFRPDGNTHGDAGNFTYCPAHPDLTHARSVAVTLDAQTYSREDTNNDGIIEGPGGRNISCS